jgi:hypothetical protein
VRSGQANGQVDLMIGHKNRKRFVVTVASFSLARAEKESNV